MSKNLDKSVKNIKKQSKILKNLEKNLKNFEKLSKMSKNVEKQDKNAKKPVKNNKIKRITGNKHSQISKNRQNCQKT